MIMVRAREQLAAIDAALGRLDDGSYGTCQRRGAADRRRAPGRPPRGADLRTLRRERLTRRGYSARKAKAVRVLAAQLAGGSAPRTAMARPASASRISSHEP
jgi:hypothetical protein